MNFKKLRKMIHEKAMIIRNIKFYALMNGSHLLEKLNFVVSILFQCFLTKYIILNVIKDLILN